ncbi:MAG: hypothetical protein HC912_05670 [Saprospiraceae bacterium]|nr:hypothetical protein [Saprospiraceae bacterium]
MLNQQNLSEFNVQEVSVDEMEFINGGANPAYDLGHWIGGILYQATHYTAKAVYNFRKVDTSMGIPPAA